MRGPIAVDPTDSDVIYVANRLPPESGMWKTTDGGKTWERYNEGWGMGNPEDILITPDNPDEILVVGGPFVGVQKSIDGGETWMQADYGIDFMHHGFGVRQLAFDRNRGLYYLADAGGPGPCGLYRSEDGIQWEKLINDCFYRVIVDEIDDELYAGAGGGRVFKSTNGGGGWEVQRSLPDDVRVMHLSKVEHSRTLYAATSSGVYKTVNGGEHWLSVNDSLMSELRFYGGIEVSSNNSNVVFAGVYPMSTREPLSALGFYITQNGEDSWKQYHKGLPDTAVGISVHRLSLDKRKKNIYAEFSMGFEDGNGKHNIYRLNVEYFLHN